jgi:hypothetical protein
MALVDRLKLAAAKLALWDSDLVAALLDHALADLEAGRWTPRRVPLWYAVARDDDSDGEVAAPRPTMPLERA